jgi:DNA polymerase-3 subunit epsilon
MQQEELYVPQTRRQAPQVDPTKREGLNFVVLDVEIATPKWWTICQLAVCVVENGEIVEQKCWLIQPPNNEYGRIQSGIHRIKAEHTENQPTFDKVWHEIKDYLDGRVVFMHNAQFDMGCLRQTLGHYKIEQPYIWYGCSYQLCKIVFPELSKHKLNVVSEHLNIPLNHHDAASDTRATTLILLSIATAYNICHLEGFYLQSRWEWGRLTPIDHLPHFCRTNNRPSENVSGLYEGIIPEDETPIPEKRIVEVSMPERVPEHHQVLKGLNLVFTGKFENGSSDEMKLLAYVLGAEILPKVTKNVDYLVTGIQATAKVKEKLSEKERTAQKLGIAVMNEQMFFSKLSVASR